MRRLAIAVTALGAVLLVGGALLDPAEGGPWAMVAVGVVLLGIAVVVPSEDAATAVTVWIAGEWVFVVAGSGQPRALVPLVAGAVYLYGCLLSLYVAAPPDAAIMSRTYRALARRSLPVAVTAVAVAAVAVLVNSAAPSSFGPRLVGMAAAALALGVPVALLRRRP